MQRFRNFRGGLMFCAITTFVMGAGSQVIAQNEPATQKPSNPPAAVEQKPVAAEPPRHVVGNRGSPRRCAAANGSWNPV